MNSLACNEHISCGSNTIKFKLKQSNKLYGHVYYLLVHCNNITQGLLTGRPRSDADPP